MPEHMFVVSQIGAAVDEQNPFGANAVQPTQRIGVD